jgi:hypothetical protein
MSVRRPDIPVSGLLLSLHCELKRTDKRTDSSMNPFAGGAFDRFGWIE